MANRAINAIMLYHSGLRQNKSRFVCEHLHTTLIKFQLTVSVMSEFASLYKMQRKQDLGTFVKKKHVGKNWELVLTLAHKPSVKNVCFKILFILARQNNQLPDILQNFSNWQLNGA